MKAKDEYKPRNEDEERNNHANFYLQLATRLLYLAEVFTKTPERLLSGEVKPRWPFMAVAVTPSAGFHFYFKCAHPERFSASVSGVCDSVDIRAGGAVIIAPNSYREPKLEAGKKRPYFDAYFALDDFSQMVELPPLLASLIPVAGAEAKTSRKASAQTVMRRLHNHSSLMSSRDYDYKYKLFELYQQDFIRDAVESKRNKCLFIGAIKSIEAGIPFDEVSDVFTDLALSTGLHLSEIAPTIKSAFDHASSH